MNEQEKQKILKEMKDRYSKLNQEQRMQLVHSWLMKQGYRPAKVQFEHTAQGVHCGFYRRKNSVVHIEDVVNNIDKYAEVKEND